MPIVTKCVEFCKKYKVLFIALMVLFFLEGVFDILEITIGQFMLWTNDKRPKVGRLWTEEERDQEGQRQATTRIDSLRQQPIHLRYIHSLDDLIAFLAYKSNLSMSKYDFLSIYRNFPAEEAAQLVDPYILKDLSENSAWYSVRLTQAEHKLVLLFMDPFGQPLLDRYVYLDPHSRHLLPPRLQENPLFAGRIVDRETFLAAYEKLPVRLQLQIINNPQKWEEWEPKLLQAGISSNVTEGSVIVALEVVSPDSTEVYSLQASELAVGYLITGINEVAPQSYGLSMPVKEVAHD